MKLKDSDYFETPSNIFLDACEFFKVYPTLDVCATKQNTKCQNYFSSNALEKNWSEDFFMNCPYSNGHPAIWVKYAYLQHVKHNVNGLALLPSSTGSEYWHNYIFDGKAEILFWRGRIRFNLDGVKTKFNPTFDSVFVCWRKKTSEAFHN